MTRPDIALPPIDGQILVDVDAAFYADAPALRAEQRARITHFDPGLFALASVMHGRSSEFETDADPLGQQLRTYGWQQAAMVHDLLNRDAARRQGKEVCIRDDGSYSPLPRYTINASTSKIIDNLDAEQWQEALQVHDPAMAAIIEGRLFPSGAEKNYDTHQAQIMGATAVYAVVNHLVATTINP